MNNAQQTARVGLFFLLGGGGSGEASFGRRSRHAAPGCRGKGRRGQSSSSSSGGKSFCRCSFRCCGSL